MTVQSPFLGDDQFLIRAFGKIPDMREITFFHFACRRSSMAGRRKRVQ
jgi:hypothetical protein